MRPPALLVAALLVATACSTPSRAPADPALYLVRAQGTGEIPASTARAILRIAPVEVAAHIRGIAIVTPDGRVRTMVQQGFAAPLATLVEDAVTDRLRASGRYGTVLSPRSVMAAPVSLRLAVREFEILVTDTSYVARVTFDGVIERDGAVVRSFRAGAERLASGADGPAFVRALEDAMNGAIDAVQQQLEEAGIGGLAELLPPTPAEREG
jgi:ABC-type uncharacterized transport system auxiliary subunit